MGSTMSVGSASGPEVDVVSPPSVNARSASGPEVDVVPQPSVTAPTPTPPVTEPSDSNDVRNPGDYEELCKRVRDQLLPTALEGGKVVIQKGISNHFQTSHTLSLGTKTLPPSWSFGATYVGTTKLGENEYRPVMLGEISNSGNFNCLFIHQNGPWKMKVNGQTKKSKWVGYQGTVDYSGSDFTASATAANPNILDGSGVIVGQYLQSLTSRLSLGTELIYQKAEGMQGAMLSVGGSYATPKWETAARLGFHAWQLTYLHKLDSNLIALADMEGSLMQGETNANVGFQYDMKGGVSVRGAVGSQGTVTVTADKTLDPFPGVLTLSAQINHWTDESKVGMSVILG